MTTQSGIEFSQPTHDELLDRGEPIPETVTHSMRDKLERVIDSGVYTLGLGALAIGVTADGIKRATGAVRHFVQNRTTE